ncbi:Fur family transcriptional regulator [Paraburkholderia tropica]|uniref:Fur family transcriptional regulator n=1 Tax=Paraburkholderia tropica TaxID=92647 RepID=UPI0038B92E88
MKTVGQDSVNANISTVYRALSNLLEVGLITGTSIGGGRIVYEFNRGVAHSHLVCRDCGRVCDVDWPVSTEQYENYARSQGYSYLNSSLVIFGRCPKCSGGGHR